MNENFALFHSRLCEKSITGFFIEALHTSQIVFYSLWFGFSDGDYRLGHKELVLLVFLFFIVRGKHEEVLLFKSVRYAVHLLDHVAELILHSDFLVHVVWLDYKT